MPKMRTRSTVKKRFRVTKSGHVKRKKANLRHILTTKNRKRKRRLGKMALVNPVQARKLMAMIA
jgi:large subunit ribosomal protein L35